MARRSKKRGRRRDPAIQLSADLFVEILSRVPYKSLCACKCVSRRWCGVVSDPDHRKKLPQTLAGFFHRSFNIDRFPMVSRHFANVSGARCPVINPALPFLPEHMRHNIYLHILDCSNGFILCRNMKPDDLSASAYVVCNPATWEYVVVPQSIWSMDVPTVYLGFAQAVSSHFYVFEFKQGGLNWYVEEMQIYSSETGVWTHKDIGWNSVVAIRNGSRSLFFNGKLHVVTREADVATVDVEGNAWTIIHRPLNEDFHHLTSMDGAIIGVSQGCLYLATTIAKKISIWFLEDYGSEEWTLKHTLSYLDLFHMGILRSTHGCNLVSIHPDCNMIFLVTGYEKTLISYQIDHRVFYIIRVLGHDSQEPYLPYIPNFSGTLVDGHANY